MQKSCFHALSLHPPPKQTRSNFCSLSEIVVQCRGFVVVVHLTSGLLQEGNEVVAVGRLLQATESHLGARNVLLGVLEVLEL
jgi:hypothetical protein